MNFEYKNYDALVAILTIYVISLLIAGTINTKPPVITTPTPVATTTGTFMALKDRKPFL